ncbi:MAG: LytTR family DNA-binding domain-containing protein [Oscillospiraceae bacterium]|nr:LytTR family DNA-binding domain-containing protein [Oscillospiraceae bacterium]
MRIAVCDDDKDFLKNVFGRLIERAVRQAQADAHVSFFTDSKALLEEFGNSGFDLVILDIDMPRLNGKELAAELRLLDSTFFLVFATSYRDEVYNTIPYRINAFITKDSPPDAITAELVRVIRECAEFSPEVCVLEVIANGEKKLARIPMNDLFCFCCIKRKIYLHTGKSEYLLAESRFADIEERFLAQGFYEVCRGYIVNTGKISLVGKTGVTLDNGEVLPLSRGRYKELQELLLSNITMESDLL